MAFKRKVLEETGCKVEIEKLLGVIKEKNHMIISWKLHMLILLVLQKILNIYLT